MRIVFMSHNSAFVGSCLRTAFDVSSFLIESGLSQYGLFLGRMIKPHKTYMFKTKLVNMKQCA